MRYFFTLLLATAVLADDQLDSGTATLLSRSKHGDYEKATFSFEHGVRDDQDLRLTRNDWDLLFTNDSFHVSMVTDDRSRIVDLGPKTFAQLTEIPALPRVAEHAAAVEGHLYVVHTLDGNSNHFSAFRVVKLVAGDRCVIEWVRWRPQPARKPLALNEGVKAKLSQLLSALPARERKKAVRRRGVLAPGDVLMQLRTGAQGGNRSRFTLAGDSYRLPAQPSKNELEILKRPNSKDEAAWFLRGGLIPVGKALVIEAIDVFATAPGDNNGPGEVTVRLGNRRVFSIRDDGRVHQVWLSGRAVLLPGQERRLQLEVANSSVLEVRIRGRLIDPAKAATIKTLPFQPAVAPPRAARAGGNLRVAIRGVLENPCVVLQLRAGAGGGNPNRVNMLGKASIYVDRMSDEPLVFNPPRKIKMRDKSVAYVKGGRIPRGKVFVVKRVTYSGTARGDSNGHGELIVKILDTVIVSKRDEKKRIQGTWRGRIEVRPGQEGKVYAEVANSSSANIVVEGEFIDEPLK